MSSDDGERDCVAQRDLAVPGSPISAADMLTRSLRRSPRKTTTPTRKLFPDNIDQFAPGMTPTSRNRTKRKSVVETKAPQKRRVSLRGNSQGQAIPSGQDTGSESVNMASRLRSEQTLATPRATPGNRSLLQGDYSVISGKRRARESEDSVSLQARENQFEGWGREREESPMDLLRRLASAPGRVGSPSEDGESMMSISQQLDVTRQITSKSSLRPTGSPIPGDLTKDGLRMSSPTKRQSSFGVTDGALANRYSMANTSMAVSDVGQARRAARQSQLDNLFSDALAQDTSGNQSIGLTTFKRSDVTLPEEFLELDSNDVTFFPQTNNDHQEADLESRFGNESTRRFEDIEASIQTDGDDRPLFFTSNGVDDSNVNEEDTTITRYQDSREIEQDQSNPSISRVSFGTESVEQQISRQGEEEESGFDFLINQEVKANDGQGVFRFYPEVDSNEESSDVHDESLDESKDLQLARLALLRRRRAKKKAKRCVSTSLDDLNLALSTYPPAFA